MLIAALFISSKPEKTPMSTKERMDELWYTHSMEHYLAVKRNKLLMCEATWMNLKMIMLSERNQAQKATYCMIPFI